MNTPLLDPNTALQAGWLKEPLKDGQYHCRCGQVSIALCWMLVYGVLVYCVISYPPPLPPHANGPTLKFYHQIAHELPFFAWFPECDIVCLMPNSPPCFALTEFDYCCAPKQIKGIVPVF